MILLERQEHGMTDSQLKKTMAAGETKEVEWIGVWAEVR